MRAIAAIGRIGGRLGKTLLKIRLSIAQPTRTRHAMTIMVRLAISGTRLAEPGAAFPIKHLTYRKRHKRP